MSFLDDLYREHGNQVQDHVAGELGIDREKAATVLPQVAPIILSGLKRRMEQEGPEKVEEEIAGLGGQLDTDDIQDMLSRGSASEADPDLGGLLGNKGGEASRLMANQLGISGEAAAKLIPMIAPLIIGMLMKKGGQAGAQGGGGGLGGIASILDRNGDGNVLDDLAGLIQGGGASKVLGDVLGGATGGSGGGASKSGCLGALLGGLLKGKR